MQTDLLNFIKSDDMERLIGVVRWFDTKRGFGFIGYGAKDYFVHFKAIQGMGFKNLIENQKVSFIPRKGAKGLLADEVIILSAKEQCE